MPRKRRTSLIPACYDEPSGSGVLSGGSGLGREGAGAGW